jgi:hypothetical protein
MWRGLGEVVLNLKEKKKPFFFLDLLSAVAKVLGMYCFSDRYRQGVGSYIHFICGAVLDRKPIYNRFF